jgi:TPP-dependent pyruvate/acetoin dehydrogenase alpha subunit
MIAAIQLSRSELLDAYERMFAIRTFEETMRREFAAGSIPGTVHLYCGEEASAAGICMLLKHGDMIASTHRGHGHCVAKGCDIEGMVKEIMGRRDGLCGGKGGSLHIADLTKGMLGANGIVGAGGPLACGAALTAKLKGTKDVSVAFYGDGGSNQGAILESYNLARLWNLPVIFVVEDNGYAEATPSAWAVSGSQVRRANAFDIPAAEVDGNDFFQVYDTAAEMVERAREGGGPSLLHIKFTRFYGHFEGDAQTYRGKDEVAEARKRDPLDVFRNRVLDAALLERSDLEAVEGKIKALLEDAVIAAKNSPLPDEADLLTDVYVEY